MANELQNKLDAILEDKNTNLKPENLKAGVTCLGVEGVLEGGTIGGDVSTYVKEFASEEEMRNSASTLEDGTICKIFGKTSYETSIQNCEIFNNVIIPVTVTTSKINNMLSGSLRLGIQTGENTYTSYISIDKKSMKTPVIISARTNAGEIVELTYNYDTDLGAYTTTDITEDWYIEYDEYIMEIENSTTFQNNFTRQLRTVITNDVPTHIYEYKNGEFVELDVYNDSIAHIVENTDESNSKLNGDIELVHYSNRELSLQPEQPYDRIVFDKELNVGLVTEYGTFVYEEIIYDNIGAMTVNKLGRRITIETSETEVNISHEWIGEGTLWDNATKATIDDMAEYKYKPVKYTKTSDLTYTRQTDDTEWRFSSNGEVMDFGIVGDFGMPPLCIPNEKWNDIFKIMRDGAYTLSEIRRYNVSTKSYDPMPYNLDAISRDVLEGKVFYSNGTKTGSMPNNGELNYTPSNEEQTIPAGYTSGGIVQGDSNLIAANIKSGVSVFGITGTYEGGTSEGVKMFNSIEEMNNSTGNKEGDLAVVYTIITTPLSATSSIMKLSFPETVTLSTAITDTQRGYFYDIENGNQHLIYMTASEFRFIDYSTEWGEEIVTYNSSDGLTYTRNGTTDTYTTPATIYYSGEWFDEFSSFLNVVQPTFYGLYEYKSEETGYVLADTQFNATSEYLFSGQVAYGLTGEVVGTLSERPSTTFDDANIIVYDKLQKSYDALPVTVLTDENKTINPNIKIIPTKSDGTSLIDFSQLTDASGLFSENSTIQKLPYLNTKKVINGSNMFFGIYGNLTYIAGIDFSNMEDTNSMFYMCHIPELDFEFNMPKVLDAHSMFEQSNKLTKVGVITIPSATDIHSMFGNANKLLEVNMQETGNVTNFSYLCSDCASLVTFHTIDMSSSTSIINMFSSCPKLSDDSLNNIMESLITATSYTGTKTLAYIGLTSEQATKCTTLSNYSAFTAAGWTTGY